MAEGAADNIDVDDLVDRQPFSGFTVKVLVLALIALIADGYDVQVMSFAAPSLVRAWHLNRAALAPALSASLIGILIGASILGVVGDKYGRKPAILIGSALYSLMSLACTQAQSLDQLIVLRVLTGVGMGGVMPNVIALTAELSPQKVRAGLASVVMGGVTIGGVLPGVIVANAHGQGSWRTLFLVGGAVPLAIAVLLAAVLPESLGFLVRRGASRERIAKLVRQIAPAAEVGPNTAFSVRATEPDAGFSALFAGRLKLVTPLLWLMFATSLLSLFLLTSWMPTLLEASGFTPAEAASTNAVFQVGGVLGCIAVSLVIGRFGVPVVGAMFVLTLISVGVVARAPLPGQALTLGIAACGFCLIGAQCALNGTAGLAYPTSARSRGVGMALGVGRIGSVIGPFLGGAMVAAGVTSARDLFLLPIIPLALGAAATFVVMRRLNIRAAGSVS
jgi:AAHS family 4-hydroxybenzoate transporter-like MFS transporter